MTNASRRALGIAAVLAVGAASLACGGQGAQSPADEASCKCSRDRHREEEPAPAPSAAPSDAPPSEAGPSR